MITTKATIEKSVQPWTKEGGKHGIPLDMIGEASAQLSDPLMVFKSSMRPGVLVAVTSVQQKDGASIVVAVEMEARLGRRTATKINSFHERDIAWMNQELKAKRLLYINKDKTRNWYQSNGLSMPEEDTNYGLDGVKILTPGDIVNKGKNAPRYFLSPSGQVRAATIGKRSYFFLDRYDNESQLRDDIREEAGHRLINELGGAARGMCR